MKALQPLLLRRSAGQAEMPQLGFWTCTERRRRGEGKRLPRPGGGTLKTPPPHPPIPTQAKPWPVKSTTPCYQ